MDRIFRLIRETRDENRNVLRVFFGPSRRISKYKRIGISTEEDAVYYIQTIGKYRFYESDLYILLEKYLENLQFNGERKRAKSRFRKLCEAGVSGREHTT